MINQSLQKTIDIEYDKIPAILIVTVSTESPITTWVGMGAW